MGSSIGQFRELPGPKAREKIEAWQTVTMTSVYPSLVWPVRGSGVYIMDADENEYLDFNAGIGSIPYGYDKGLAPFVDAIRELHETSGMLMRHSSYYGNDQMLSAIQKLLALTPTRLGKPKYFGATSGTMAVEGAMKALAMKKYHQGPMIHPEKITFLSFERAFHGRSGAALSLIGAEHYQRVRGLHLPYKRARLTFPTQGDDSSCQKFFTELDKFLMHNNPDAVAGMFAEIVQGEGGVYPIDNSALRHLDSTCAQYNIPLIIDEIQTGFYRCGDLFAYMLHGIAPDGVLIGKAAGAGTAPVCAMIMDECFDFKEYGEHGGTFGNDPLFGEILSRNIDLAQKMNLGEHAREMGEFMLDRLAEALGKEERIKDIRGLGLLTAVEVCNPNTHLPDPDFCRLLWQTCEKFGLIVLPAGNSAIRFEPPLIVNKDEIALAVEIFSRAYFRANILMPTTG